MSGNSARLQAIASVVDYELPTPIDYRSTPSGDVFAENVFSLSVMKERLQDAAKKKFRPEFINRIDEIIVFHTLEKDDLRKIVDLEMSQICKRLQKHEISLKYDNVVKDFLIEQGYKPEYGARPIRRIVERFVEDPLAEEIIGGKVKDGETIRLKPGEKELIFEKIDISKQAVK